MVTADLHCTFQDFEWIGGNVENESSFDQVRCSAKKCRSGGFSVFSVTLKSLTPTIFSESAGHAHSQ
jgi:hypothetical protein